MLYPGRVANAATWDLLELKEVKDKPWVKELPRLIFISDMGDALSKSVPFDYLREEIVGNISSSAGRQHIWLWLTKLLGRMAEFATWLHERGIPWPHNLVPMTTVTMQRYWQSSNEVLGETFLLRARRLDFDIESSRPPCAHYAFALFRLLCCGRLSLCWGYLKRETRV
jgi:hypothetical protein